MRRFVHWIYGSVFLGMSGVVFVTFFYLTFFYDSPWFFLSFALTFLYVGIYAVRIAMGADLRFPKSLRNTFAVFMLGTPLVLVLIYHLNGADSFGPSLQWADIAGLVIVVLALESVLFIGVIFPLWIVWQALLWVRNKLQDANMQPRSA